VESQALDSLDLKLPQALQLDGRAPFNRIAEVLEVSHQTIARRFRRLHTTVRLRVLGITDETRLGRSNWLIRLGCTPGAAEQLAHALARRPDISPRPPCAPPSASPATLGRAEPKTVGTHAPGTLHHVYVITAPEDRRATARGLQADGLRRSPQSAAVRRPARTLKRSRTPSHVSGTGP
jgi:DNA-binding Lrp family transcriptional regulator